MSSHSTTHTHACCVSLCHFCPRSVSFVRQYNCVWESPHRSIIPLCGYLYRSFYSIQLHVIVLCTYELRTLNAPILKGTMNYEICVTDIDDTRSVPLPLRRLLLLIFDSYPLSLLMLHFYCAALFLSAQLLSIRSSTCYIFQTNDSIQHKWIIWNGGGNALGNTHTQQMSWSNDEHNKKAGSKCNYGLSLNFSSLGNFVIKNEHDIKIKTSISDFRFFFSQSNETNIFQRLFIG